MPSNLTCSRCGSCFDFDREGSMPWGPLCGACTKKLDAALDAADVGKPGALRRWTKKR